VELFLERTFVQKLLGRHF